MKYIHFIILLIAIFIFNKSYSQTEPKQYTIGGITISGTKYLDADFLKIKTNLSVGQEITIPGEEIGKAINALWKEGLFANIQVNIDKTIGNAVFLDFVITERPRLNQYTYKGVGKTEAEDLNKKMPFIKGKVLTENLKINAEQKIKEYFIDKGFGNMSINTIEKPDSIIKNTVNLIFVINKGVKVKIEDIFFIGNKNITNSKLKRTCKETKERFRLRPFTNKDWYAIQHSSPKKFFKGLYNLSLPVVIDELSERFRIKLSGSKFQKEPFEDDKNKIVELYNNKGYRDAQIIKDSVYKHNSGNLNIVLNINEGKRYYYRNIYWKGNTKHTDKELSEILSIQKGDVYDKKALDEKLNMNANSTDVSSLYMDDGYLFFSINPVEIAVVEDSIDMEIRIYEGQQATINKVVIKGNDKTKEHVIRRELRTVPGQKFSRTDIIRSQRELATLGYFNNEKIGIQPVPHQENGTVDIEYTLEEKSSDQIELQAGWGGKNGGGVIGTVGLSFNNFSIANIGKKNAWAPVPSGDGQKLGLRIQSNGKYYQSGTLSFSEPWLGGKKPNQFSVAYYYTRYSNYSTYATTATTSSLQTTNGISVSLGKRLKWPDDFFTIIHGLNFENYNLKNQSLAYVPIANGQINNFNFEENISRNSLNDPIYPRSGSRFALVAKFTPPYSLINNLNYSTISEQRKYKFIEYHKWRFDAEWFTRIKGNLVLRSSNKFGFLGNYSGKTGDSPFERFEVGGDGISNVRLYGKDIFALRGYDVTDLTSKSNGSIMFNKFTLELRYPITLNPSSTIFVLSFLEGGNTYSSFKTYNPFNLKRSVGLGVRVLLPMFGLLGVDYGIGVDKAVSNAKRFTDYGKFNIILGYEPQ